MSDSVIGERANVDPQQPQRPEFTVEAIDHVDGEVCVRYVGDTDVEPWWITEKAWDDWKALTMAR